MPELIAYRDEKEARLAALYSERSELKNQLKRAQRKNDAPAEEAIKGKVAQISEQAKVLRKEAAICNEIAQRSGQIETNRAELQNQYDGKEITTDEHTSGEAADQVVRMTLNGVEVAAKLSGAAAKQVAVMLYAILKDQKRTKARFACPICCAPARSFGYSPYRTKTCRNSARLPNSTASFTAF
jgi:chromosome segregation ATPase